VVSIPPSYLLRLLAFVLLSASLQTHDCPLKAKGSNMGILGEESYFAMRSFVTSHLTILTLAWARDSL
jgi:hypothetical protein